MILGIVLTCMTALAILAVLAPLARRRAVAAGGGEAAVYRDQLAEVERDRARGVIPAAEAVAAHTEIARRLIAAAEKPATASGDTGPGATRRRRGVAVLALVALPLLASAGYMTLGRPDLPDRPLAARQQEPAGAAGLDDLMARVEAEVSRRPEDGRGWEVLAPVYLRTGRAADAATAFGNAIRLLGSTAPREAGRGEALTLAADGQVTSEAKAAFDRALALEPAQPQARFYLARAAEQAGDFATASRFYRALLTDAPPDAPWRAPTKQALTAAALGRDGQMPAVDPQQMASQNPEQRLATIRGMVDGLEARLKVAPDDVAGQLRLIRAWTMLGDRQKARAAALGARTVLAGNADALQRIDDLVLGLDLEENPA
jgi:cytochrome c-type biogenesis protein CcmH